MRYRAQRMFQHPERDVSEPSKRISVIGERTMIKILQNMQMNVHSPRVQTYLNSFFYDLIWDDPQVFLNLYEHISKSEVSNSSNRRRVRLFNRMKFINSQHMECHDAISTIIVRSTVHRGSIRVNNQINTA